MRDEPVWTPVSATAAGDSNWGCCLLAHARLQRFSARRCAPKPTHLLAIRLDAVGRASHDSVLHECGPPLQMEGSMHGQGCGATSGPGVNGDPLSLRCGLFYGGGWTSGARSRTEHFLVSDGGAGGRPPESPDAVHGRDTQRGDMPRAGPHVEHALPSVNSNGTFPLSCGPVSVGATLAQRATPGPAPRHAAQLGRRP